MFGPTPKYWGYDSDPFTGVPLYWKAHPEGFPVRADTAPAFVERARLGEAGVTLDAVSKFFELPKDNDAYTAVIDWIANGNGVLRFEKETPGKEPGTWHVWVVWLNVRGHLPGAGPLQKAVGDARPAGPAVIGSDAGDVLKVGLEQGAA